MLFWGRSPIRFFAIFTAVGILLGYGLFSVILGLPEGIAMGLGMIIIWPITTYLEYQWRQKAKYRMIDNKVSSVCSISTWIFNGVIAIIFTGLFILVELKK